MDNKLKLLYVEMTGKKTINSNLVSYVKSEDGDELIEYFLSPAKQAVVCIKMDEIGKTASTISETSSDNLICVYSYADGSDQEMPKRIYSEKHPNLILRYTITYDGLGKLKGNHLKVYADVFSTLTDYEREKMKELLPMYSKYLKPNSVRFIKE